ncbi:MAG: hypothetical protein WBA02_13490 [Jannaschia helgolandensis]|uniref:Uncharacterized protein n=1 Tax=Jannaschia helgolandensis TaxID=188906 RepID=A0A1H7LCP6_9RHOB|nr:hypothetical protein [Jannaschia helgolandensis]SEK96570.1 hypothetical protein SAMN04488526_1683 [Jannaschia helgolandensis]
MNSRFSAAIRGGLSFRSVSQATFAEDIDVSNNTVTSWVTDKTLPNKRSMPLVQTYFEWSDAKLLMLLEDWHLNVRSEKACHIAGTDFVTWKYGGDYVRFLEELIALDQETIDGAVGEHEGTPDQWAPIFKNNPDTWKLLVKGDKVVGYWQFHCLKREAYDLVVNGDITDADITLDMVTYPEIAGNYFAHLPVITTRKEIRGIRTIKLIIDSLCASIRQFASDDVYFESFAAVAFTDQGKQLCERLGLRYKIDHPRTNISGISKIYEINGIDVPASYFGRDPLIREKYIKAFQ